LPIISQFYGIVVFMYYNDMQKHHIPHIHVRYNEYKAVYDLDSNLLEGKMPIKQRKMIEAWIVIHLEELNTLWKLIQENQEYFKIEPLK